MTLRRSRSEPVMATIRHLASRPDGIFVEPAGELFQIDHAIEDKLVRMGIDGERSAQGPVKAGDHEHDQADEHGEEPVMIK